MNPAFPRTFVVLSFLLFAAFMSARAATYTWDGSSNDLNSPHWLPGPVAWPGEGHDMIINGGVVAVTDSQTIYRPQNVIINGGTLKITPSGGLFPGSDATSRVITVNAGGTLELETWFKADSQSLGRLAQDAARLVVNGGTIRVNGVTGYGRGVTVNSAGAIFEAAFGADWLLNNLTDDVAWIYNGNPTLIFTGAGEGRLDKIISGGCSVIKRGQGKWTLARSNTYTGNTTVEQGVLALRRATLADTSTVSIANGAILSLRHQDGDAIGSLVLGGVAMPPGTYNRATHPQYLAGSGALIVGGPAAPGNDALTWFYGGGGDAGIQQTITDSMNHAVGLYNDHGYFTGNIRAEYNSGVPTAQAGYNGPITFGGSRNGRVALHEMGHVFGVGTRGEWDANFNGSTWIGPNTVKLIQQIDGPGAGIFRSGVHFFPYGLNFDNEGGLRNEITHVRIMEAKIKDMGFFRGSSTITAIGERTIAPSTSTGAIAFTVGDPAVAATSLVVRATSSNPVLVPPSALVLGGSGANRTVTVTPTAGMSGTAIIAVSVSGGRDAVVETFLLTVGSYLWTGGSGVWDTITPNWTGAGTTWPAIGENNDAIFGGTPGTVTVRGSVNVDDIAFNSNGYVVSGDALNFVNSPAVTVASGVTATIGSSLTGSANGLAKEGAGTLVLAGNSAFGQGIFANGGTLLVNGDYLDTSLFAVRNGATLGGAGHLPDTTIETGGTLSPGPGIAELHTEDLTFQAGSVLRMELGLVNSDHLAVTGNLTLAGSLIVQVVEPPTNGFHTLITYTGTRTGTLALSVPAGYAMSLDYSVAGQVRLLVNSGGLASSDLIPFGATWKYNAGGGNLGTLWRRLDYNDANPLLWPSGPAEIGYGDDDEATEINISGGKPQILYFRKSFNLTAAEIAGMSRLILHLLRDDGAVVYLNGVEVSRDNLPAPPASIAYNTPALGPVSGVNEQIVLASEIPTTLLNAGSNVLAVEVHQDDPESSDISFDLRLEAALGDPDTDDDGLTDAWEIEWFNSLAAQTGAGDADSDGTTNLAEMKARTSPLSRAQTFAINTWSLNASGQFTLSWPSVLGVIYQVRRSDDLISWTTLPGTIIGDGLVKTYTDTQPLPAETTSQFYQVVVP